MKSDNTPQFRIQDFFNAPPFSFDTSSLDIASIVRQTLVSQEMTSNSQIIAYLRKQIAALEQRNEELAKQ